MPNIRPNCPPPKRPIVEPGGISVSMRSNLKRSRTHGKLKNSRIQEFKEFRSSGVQEFRRQIPMSARINTGSNTSLIGWKPVNHRPYGRPILQLLTSEF